MSQNRISGVSLDREKAFLVATPFKKRGKKSLKISDFIFALYLDMKWGPPEKVRALLRDAESEGLVKMDGDMVFATFDAEAVDVPVGFKPTTDEGILDRGIRLITSQTGMSRKEVIALANERQDSLQKLVELDAVVLLVARELGLDVSSLAEEAYRNLLARVQQDQKAP
ncbi:MAG: hypothetical protein A4E44_02275 [Methanosaeta sp. PtaB.Bin018]|jgi:hypothetical protein|nr:DUF2240 family protein [Methanothrix sp.]OPX74060.1 MAG: hypothetical protein A4E44_02275 [Methanosaeta sp. PtaB.Bin018]OPY47430.1 MAG: hypothetical protein A4E46_00438 [Methanosaeta sp. PtaU1.Bin016]